MLVLSRKLNESIVIDGTVTITIVAVEGNKVRLGILAPKKVIVDRQEVHERRKGDTTTEASAVIP